MTDRREMIIKKNWNDVLKRASSAALKSGRDPEGIKIIAVSKTQASETVLEACNAGIKSFGENYAQELEEKFNYFKDNNTPNPEWHFIGHLQRNKVKFIAPFVSLIHSVDSAKLAKEISKQAKNNNRIIKILLQVNTSGELSKSGCDPDSIVKLTEEVIDLKNIEVQGLMTIGSFSEDESIIRKEFRILKTCRDNAVKAFPNVSFNHLSMGMTHDYEIAIDEGATIVRVGTAIFGQRSYK